MTIALAPLSADEAERCARRGRTPSWSSSAVWSWARTSAVRDVVAALVARGHVLLEGVPGTAKTLLVRTLEPGAAASSSGGSSSPRTSCPRTSPA